MSNRTKGNVKPSNSERASRLLTTNKFLSFSEASKNLSSVYKATDGGGGGGGTSGLKQNDSSTSAFDCEISSDFQQIFKHMAKKDVNTKIKAMEEFVELCHRKNPNELLNIARFWFRLYRKLANSLEWNIRNASHETQYEFISSLDKNLLMEYFEPSINNESSTDYRNGEISFQTLITMPAVMWNSCFDAYNQPFQSARNVFRYLFSRDKTINFLLDNCDSILNYCLYFLFNKIPIELFYNTSLPADSIRMFDDHQIGICLLGISTMINELLCFYKKNIDENNNVYKCLEKIFIRFNEEFVRCKGLMDDDNTDDNDQTSTTTTVKTLENRFEELEMSRKEKKRLNRNYFSTIMNGMVDSTIEIRGISWLLASHLLSNQNDLFNQLWSIVDRPNWLEKILKPFIVNGMKSSGSIIDFGIDRIGLKSYLALYPELSFEMDKYFSGLRLICPQYYQQQRFMIDFNDKINLIMVFIRSFNQNQAATTTTDQSYSIFDLFLRNLLISIDNIGLLTDMLFLIELFFNIINFALQESLLEESSCIEHLHCLLKRTMNNEKRDLYLRSQIYLNHLLLINRLMKQKFNEQLVTRLANVYEDLLTNYPDDDNLAILRFMTES
uniref:E3 ubiquitin-protein ligase listerin n=1 Tax=Dermatophagoides pteronyssinus TaxID=6956 RepID=A0A6P6YCR3_DERPT